MLRLGRWLFIDGFGAHCDAILGSRFQTQRSSSGIMMGRPRQNRLRKSNVSVSAHLSFDGLPSKAFYKARSLSLIFTGTCEKCTLLAIVPWSHSAGLGTNGKINKTLGAFSRRYTKMLLQLLP
jgi:hypothetical protein